MFKVLTRRASLLSLLLIVIYGSVNAQLSKPGLPESFLIKEKSAVVLPVKTLTLIDTASLIAEDAKSGISNRYGIVQNVNVDIKNDGVKSEISGKGFIWQYKIESKQTYSLGIFFSKYSLPEGAKVFIYDEDHEHLLGAFTSVNNNSANCLNIAELAGKNAIVEYFEPLNPAFSGELTIGTVSQSYKDIQATTATTRIGINCTQGANWQELKHAVCRMLFTSGTNRYYCSGSLVNNVRLDGTPYFLTACHCISTSSEASSLIVYFNYENSTCSNSDASDSQTLSGATLKAASTYSDFSLLQINETPPTTYSPFFAGWDASSRSPQTGTCIHHPAGTPKCISLDYNAPTTYDGTINWDNTSTTVPNTHWEVVFNAGNTEGGSSGSPLLDDNKRVIGQLHGGDNSSSFYGKFSLSWNHNSSAAQQLKTWLDPDNTGTLFLDGLGIKPEAKFASKVTSVCKGSTVSLVDSSKYYPSSWSWTISPSTYQFTNNTNRNSENPQVIFLDNGYYSVKLAVANKYGVDTLLMSNYIYASDRIKVAISGVPSDSVVCGCDMKKYPLIVSGADKYSYTIERSDNVKYSTGNDTLYLSLRTDNGKISSFTTKVKVTGTSGTCVASDLANLKIVIPVNDSIQNAVRIWPGSNISYSNKCATADSNEPTPSLAGCYSNDSWCSGGEAVKRSIWFTFVGPSSKAITIDTKGFNDRIAVYKADSYSDILSGNSSSYEILAANDNRSATDNTAQITNLEVEPGKVYWLQVDGYQGLIGDCSVNLICNSLDVFPNPSTGKFEVIISNANDGSASLDVFSTQGKLMFTQRVSVTGESNKFDMDLSPLPAGIYILQVKINGSSMKTKIVIVK